MPRTGVVLGMIAVMMLVVRIGIVNSNRLISDLNTHQERQQISKDYEPIREVRDRARLDMYRDLEGYTASDGLYHIHNNKERVETETEIDHVFVDTEDTLYIQTSDGRAKLTNPLPDIQWKYDESIVDWDGSTLKLLDGNSEYLMYILTIYEDNTERLENIYNLDYYTKIPEGSSYSPDLEGGVGILVKTKNNAVTSYVILNSEIEEFEGLVAYNLEGKRVLQIAKNSLSRYLQIPYTIMFDLITGHYVEVNLDYINRFEFEAQDHILVSVETPIWEGELDHDEYQLEVDLSGEKDNNLVFEIYGTDIYSIKVFHEMLLK